MDKPNVASVKTYKSLHGGLKGSLLALIIIPIVFYLLSYVVEQDGILAVPFVFSVVPVLLGMLSSFESLNVSKEGIQYTQGNRHSFSAWEDLSYFEMRNEGISTIIGIVSKKLEVQQSGNIIFRLLFAWRFKSFIPLEHFGYVTYRLAPDAKSAIIDFRQFTKTQLGSTLLYFAPQLFENAEAKFR